MAIVEVQEISKTYGGWKGGSSVTVLHHISMALSEGEVVALLGLNGAGKSTLVKIILDLVRATKGRVRLFGQPNCMPGWKPMVGYLPEHFRPPPGQTAHEFLFTVGGISGLQGDTLSRGVERVVSLFGLEGQKSIKTHQFSKGLNLRLGLAQAFLHQPRLLFLDEPTDGLDPEGRRAVREAISGLRARGASVLLNSHLLSEVETVADRIAILDKGRMVREGKVQEMLSGEETFLVKVVDDPGGNERWKFVHGIDGWSCRVTGVGRLRELLLALSRKGMATPAVKPVKTTMEDLFLASVGRNAEHE